MLGGAVKWPCAAEGKIRVAEPLEQDSEGEPGGGVESWLPVFNDDSVDIRLNQDDLAVPVPLYSGAAGAGLVVRSRTLIDGRSVQSASSCNRPLGVDALLYPPPLVLFDGDIGRPRELLF